MATPKRVKFDNWHDLPDFKLDPDRLFGSCAVTTNTYQLAVQACLEALGTTLAPLPVVLPVTSSPQVMAGVLRAGAQPVLIDIDPVTLQMDVGMVTECAKELEGCIFVLNRPMGQPVSPELLEATKDSVSIVDTRLVAYPDMPMDELCGTFTLYDLGPLIGEGAVILQRHPDLHGLLKTVRSGMLGLSGALTPHAASLLKPQLGHVDNQYAERRKILSEYNRLLSEYSMHDRIHFNHSRFPHYVLLKCENPRLVITYLEQWGFPAMHGVFGLHNLSSIKERFKEIPEYPNADAAQAQLVALPMVKTVEEVEQVLKYFREVA